MRHMVLVGMVLLAIAVRPWSMASQVSHSKPESEHNKVGKNMSQTSVPAEVVPHKGKAQPAALALQRLGFRILHIGTTISVEGAAHLWESVFNVSFTMEKKGVIDALPDATITYPRAVTADIKYPETVKDLVKEVIFVEPPEFDL